MLLEQSYNADAKEQSELDGITLSEAARTKWVYTKPVTALISAVSQLQTHITSPVVTDRYKEQLLKDVPAGSKIIHFCCD